jgi:Nucleoside diphosphate kinase
MWTPTHTHTRDMTVPQLARHLTVGILKPDLLLRFVQRTPSSCAATHLSSFSLAERQHAEREHGAELSEFYEKHLRPMLSAQGLRVHARKRMRFTKRDAERFYADHCGRFFYPRLVNYMTRWVEEEQDGGGHLRSVCDQVCVCMCVSVTVR